MMTITKDEALRTLREVVEENPDRTNNGVCRYVRYEPDGTALPNCIAGVALSIWGTPIETLTEMDRQDGSSIDLTHDMTGLVIDPEAVQVLLWAQRRADKAVEMPSGDFQNGVTPWAEVMEYVDAAVTDD